MRELCFVLHNLRSAYNVGSIFRTADGIGVSRIYLTGYTMAPADPTRPYETKAERMLGKTALGAQKTVPWEKNESFAAVAEDLRERGFAVVAVEQTPESVDYRSFSPPPTATGLALVLGNEPRGLEERDLALCDSAVEIPMRGSKKSLNVAVAAGVVGYHFRDDGK